MTRYSMERRTINYVKGYGFLSFARNLYNKYRKQLLDREINASKKVIHKAAKATGEFLGNKTADAVAKSSDLKIVKTKPVHEIVIPLEKKEEILNEFKTSIIKMEHYKIHKSSNDSPVSKSVTKKWLEVNDLSSGQYSVNKNKRLKTSMLRSNLCDYSDACTVEKGTIDLLAAV